MTAFEHTTDACEALLGTGAPRGGEGPRSRPLYFWCLVCRAPREGAECERCGNACVIRPVADARLT